jgi:hypothetical protein
LGASVIALVAIVASLMLRSSKGDTTPLQSDTSVPSTETTTPTIAKPLKAPRASVASDAQFLSDVTEVDPALLTYEKKTGNLALRSLLTDGSAFCAFLNRDSDIDSAMVSVAVGAREVESQTHLPLSVTTFNAVDAVALLTLCPSLESVVPSKDMAKIRKLGAELTPPSN